MRRELLLLFPYLDAAAAAVGGLEGELELVECASQTRRGKPFGFLLCRPISSFAFSE